MRGHGEVKADLMAPDARCLILESVQFQSLLLHISNKELSSEPDQCCSRHEFIDHPISTLFKSGSSVPSRSM